MAAVNNNSPITAETLITIKISVNDQLKKLKLPLRDLGVAVLPDKLRQVLDIKPEQTVVLERYSDSAGGYISLNESNPQAFKTLIRAAKAKLKLRLKATVSPVEPKEVEVPKPVQAVQEVMETAMNATPRSSRAFDQRSVGTGIFQFREARASQQTLVNTDEAPVPGPFTTDRSSFFNDLVAPAPAPALAFRPREPVGPEPIHQHAWSVYCNECDKAMSNEHYHCNICDGGDYDLCQECVDSGKVCPGVNHWLIKRFIQDGKVVSSTTERVSPQKPQTIPAFIKPVEKEMPGAFTDDTKTLAMEPCTPTRTCNSCVIALPEREFVTCTACEDFDLCIKCYTADKHGHHPAHGFKPATEETILPLSAETKLAPGRNVRHNAICDGCDKQIYGVRNKCLNCPDFDYCNGCIKSARHTHPHHRFAPLYEPITDQTTTLVRHFGIYCDGPLCKKADQAYIHGVRYKCTICHDTDFCASCEAVPGNHHNRTHPLIKLKTPVRNVSVSTENEDQRGNMRFLGDRHASHSDTKSIATETTPMPQANAAAQVQTVAEFTPTEVKKETQPIPIPVKLPTIVKKEDNVSHLVAPAEAAAPVPAAMLNAHFVRDSIPDGMTIEPEARFIQIWVLKNPGPYAWPAGCSVRYVGGDNMLNVDNSHPASVAAINDATESNVVGRDVQVGEEVAFKVMLKAPVREGKAISYWRLKAADGTPFGHRLWCDIEIKKIEPPAPVNTREQEIAANDRTRAYQQVALQQAMLNRDRLLQAQQMARLQVEQQSQQQAQQAQMAQQAQQQALAREHFNQALNTASTDKPPAYENALSARLAVMREQQKQRREQMVAQMNAQREQLQAQGIKREDMPSWSQHANTPSQIMKDKNEKERRDALKQRVAHIKANIMKSRAEREAFEKQVEELDNQKTAAAEKKTAEETKIQNIVDQVTKQADEEEKLEGSQMVFPKLEKESPSSSTYESATSSTHKGKAAYVENEQGEVERSAAPVNAPVSIPISSPTPNKERFDYLDDDLEVLSADDDESSDGFVTDDEWDILDASDEETVASK